MKRILQNIKNIDLSSTHSLSRSKHKNQLKESPCKINIKIKHAETQNKPSFMQTLYDEKQRSKEKQMYGEDITERTHTESIHSQKQKASMKSFQSVGHFNIKSYVRIKPPQFELLNEESLPLILNKDHINNINKMNIQISQKDNKLICEHMIYKFDKIFLPQHGQKVVYDQVAKDVVCKFMDGYNCTIFAYGNTGSGKTYTMFGSNGIIPSAVLDIFEQFDARKMQLSCSMMEIYKEQLIDLLSENQNTTNILELKIKETNPNNITIQNLTKHQITSIYEVKQFIEKGNNLKKIRETKSNILSSRSHVIFTIYLQKQFQNGNKVECKLNLVDLAGSEKVYKSKVEGEGLEEAKKINLSLSCLGNTIQALVKGDDHIPYRQSKLTRILKESLMGNSITRLIVTCSIQQHFIEEAISSFKFAQRARKIKTQAEISLKIKDINKNKAETLKFYKEKYLQSQKIISKIQKTLQISKDKCCCHNQIKDVLSLHNMNQKNPQSNESLNESKSLLNLLNNNNFSNLMNFTHENEDLTPRKYEIDDKILKENFELKKQVLKLQKLLQKEEKLEEIVPNNYFSLKVNPNNHVEPSNNIETNGREEDTQKLVHREVDTQKLVHKKKIIKLNTNCHEVKSPKSHSITKINNYFSVIEKQEMSAVNTLKNKSYSPIIQKQIQNSNKKEHLIEHENRLSELTKQCNLAIQKLNKSIANFTEILNPLEHKILFEQINYMEQLLIQQRKQNKSHEISENFDISSSIIENYQIYIKNIKVDYSKINEELATIIVKITMQLEEISSK